MQQVNVVRGNLLDRAVEALFPSWGAKRLLQRQTIELGYRSARHTRVDRRRSLVGSADADLETEFDRRKMVDRSRQLERDSALAEGLLSRAQENVIGPEGIHPKASSSSEDFNTAAQAMWDAWSSSKSEADVRGLHTFASLQGLVYRSRLRDGDAGAIKLSSGQLQCWESHQLASPSGVTVSDQMVDGVQLDARGRPTFYHLSPGSRRKTSRNAPKGDPIPASDVIFTARRKRLNQTRGTPGFAGVAHVFDQVDGYLEAVIMSARMSACFGMVLHSDKKRRGLTSERDIDGNLIRKMKIEPARILEVGKDDKVTQIDPRQPGSQFDEVLAAFGRILGIPFGTPLEVTMMDFSRTNYSSARAALLQAYRKWRCEQTDFVDEFVREVWEWKISQWVEDGLLTGAPGDFLRADFVATGWAWIDPMKEIEAALLAIDGGLDTLSDTCRRQGTGDIATKLRRRKAELDLIEQLGIPVGRSAKTRDTGMAPTTQTEPPPRDPEEEPADDDDPEEDDE